MVAVVVSGTPCDWPASNGADCDHIVSIITLLVMYLVKVSITMCFISSLIGVGNFPAVVVCLFSAVVPIIIITVMTFCEDTDGRDSHKK